MELTKEEYVGFAESNFGFDSGTYIIVCPMCGYEQSMYKIKDLVEQHKFFSKRYGNINSIEKLRKIKPDIERECLSPDCNYVSYGLIQLGVKVKDGYYFPLKGMSWEDD